MSRLYLLEFFIAEVNLFDQIIRDSGKAVFTVEINFVDLQSFEIIREKVTSTEKSRLEFRAGYVCHFAIPPEKLLKNIIRHPLSIKLFRKGDSFPVCLAEIPLSGCLCDQARTAPDSHPPKPYVFCGNIGLVDVGGNPSGNVDVTLRLTTRGTYVIASYVLQDNRFLFKNDSRDEEEFEVCERGKYEGLKEIGTRGENSNEEITCTWGDYVSDIASIFPSAGSIASKTQPRKTARVPLTEIHAQDEPGQETIVMKNDEKKTKTKTKKRNKNKKQA